jgi:hypothetical protein
VDFDCMHGPMSVNDKGEAKLFGLIDDPAG